MARTTSNTYKVDRTASFVCAIADSQYFISCLPLCPTCFSEFKEALHESTDVNVNGINTISGTQTTQYSVPRKLDNSRWQVIN